MARYTTLDLEGAAKAVEKAGFEPLIVDGKFMAVIVGRLGWGGSWHGVQL